MNLGPDGTLYVSIGDGIFGLSQDRTNVFGTILRMNTDGTVPADIPLVDEGGPNVDEIWACGFRNPFRTSFDRTTGQFGIGDVGGNVATQAYEEVTIGQAGANDGWPTALGFQHQISVPASVCVGGTSRQFASWSDGGARSHTVTVTANPALVATYTDTGTACGG